MATDTDFIHRVGDLAPALRSGGQRLHRPLLLLWALAQAVNGKPRQQPWSAIRASVTPLLATYAAAPGDQAAVYPFWALRNSNLWEVEGGEELSLTSDGRRPTLSVLNERDPLAGLLAEDHDLLRREPSVAARTASSVLLRFFPDVMVDLARDLDLTTLLASGIDGALRPRVGEPYANRTAIAAVYGGNGVGGITPLADGILSVYSDDKGPYDDRRVAGMDWIAYTGDGLSGDQKMSGGNRSMSTYRAEQRPLRYWHKPHGGVFTFETWVVIVQCRQRWGVGQNREPRREYVWILAPVPSPLRATWPEEVKEALAQDVADDLKVHDDLDVDLPPVSLGDPQGAMTDMERYRKLSAAARRTAAGRTDRSKLTKVERYVRSTAARQAVILRSGGRCENPTCLGHPTELTDKGDPLLEVDHVHELSRGGGDTPESMIALCPNCHTLKTRGSGRQQLRQALLVRAKALHRSFAGSQGEDEKRREPTTGQPL
ncbi:HNH endonuclease [Streptomyces sp. NPDC058745]|uniref:HNH endonuclease n=1 Tax=Streptomyces sp. NPDC058745 TaxID=3346621 RepID=UPI00367CB529